MDKIKYNKNIEYNSFNRLLNELYSSLKVYINYSQYMKIMRTQQPVYLSLTSIFKNQTILLKTLISILNQSVLPEKVFLYLSEEPYMLDSGFKHKMITNEELRIFLEKNKKLINVNWVKNNGSYRKLLPLLKEKCNEDCIIITIDDDTIYNMNLIKNLVNDYHKYKCMVGYRGFTSLFDKFENFNYLSRKQTENISKYNFLTGKGGILYSPFFFHKTEQLIFNESIYLHSCKTQDDIWFYILLKKELSYITKFLSIKIL